MKRKLHIAYQFATKTNHGFGYQHVTLHGPSTDVTSEFIMRLTAQFEDELRADGHSEPRAVVLSWQDLAPGIEAAKPTRPEGSAEGESPLPAGQAPSSIRQPSPASEE